MRSVAITLLVCSWLLVSAVGASGATAPDALTLNDTATTPLERAAFVALPAVYQVDVAVRVVALEVGSRRVKVDELYAARGTAFGVAPGLVATARHVVRPRRQDLVARVLAARRVPGAPAGSTDVRAITEPARITLRRARTEAVPLEMLERREPEPIEARLRDEDELGDMALLEIGDANAPVLPQRDDVRDGTPVAVIGFGGGADAVPSARRATLDGARVTEKSGDPRFGGLVGIDVLPGDSGAPVLDDGGRVHGVVLRPATAEDTPVIGRTQTIRDLLREQPFADGTNVATEEFRRAMDAFWRRDYRAAAAALAPQESQYTDPALVAFERRRATLLAVGPFRVSGPSRVRGALLALGAMALAAAVVLAALRLGSRSTR